ncbi:MAG: hypothetical protein ACYSWO_08455 [Planctomycetota bacterium]|jgi:hypothetical protein
MKTCPVCYENYDETATEGQVYPDVCAACNDAFGIPSPDPEPWPPSPAVPPPPPETPAERRKRLNAKARELLVLELCHLILSRRIDTDERHAELWCLKDRVAVGLAAHLRSTLPAEYRTPHPPLSDEEAQHVLATHHLLQLDRPSVATPPRLVERIRRLRTRLRSLHPKEAEQSTAPDSKDAAAEP